MRPRTAAGTSRRSSTRSQPGFTQKHHSPKSSSRRSSASMSGSCGRPTVVTSKLPDTFYFHICTLPSNLLRTNDSGCSRTPVPVRLGRCRTSKFRGQCAFEHAETNHERPIRDFSLLLGPSDVGKTCIARFTVERLRENVLDINTQYVNCCQDYTWFAVLYRLLEAIDQLVSILDARAQWGLSEPRNSH